MGCRSCATLCSVSPCTVRTLHEAGDHSLFVAAIGQLTCRGTDQPLTSQDLEYVYVGEVVRRPRGSATLVREAGTR